MSSKLSATTITRRDIIPPAVPKKMQKLVSVSVISTPMTETKEEGVEAIKTARTGKDGEENKSESPENLAWVPCIRYPTTFRKKSVPVLALFDSGSEVNAIHPICAQELRLSIRLTDIGSQKINDITLDTYGMVVAAFSVTDKVNQVRFFELTFLVANINPKVIFGMFFLTLSGADIDSLGWELQWRTYTTKEVLLTTKRIELVGKKEFAAAMLDLKSENFVIHIASLSSDASPSSFPLELDVHLSRRPQVSSLIAKEAPTKVPAKYLDFADLFSPDLASKLPEHTGINNHTIELVDGQQPPYGPIYSLEPVELKTLKTYIETNLANRFIRPSKFPAGAPILFDRKSDSFLRLCVNYQGLNNLTIKN